MSQLHHPLVIGAGLVGSLYSTLLAQRGLDVTLVDRRPDMRAAGFRGGRSINLAMSTRGWHALEMAGLADEVRKVALPMSGRLMHSVAGELTRQPYGKTGQAIYSVSRGGLNLLLLNAAEATGRVNLEFERKCEGFDKRSLAVRFRDEREGQEGRRYEVEAPVVFAADGAYSSIRSTMLRTPRFNYQQEYLAHGYKELHIAAAADGSHRLDPTALHIWPRGEFMMIALPNTDGSFTCTLFMAYAGENGFDKLEEVADARDFFEREFSDSLEHLTEFEEDWTSNPVSPLLTVRCSPWHYKERILLMGDASHAIVPFYGQGMNSGFEDCSILAERIDAQLSQRVNATSARQNSPIDQLTNRSTEQPTIDWPALVTGFGGSPDRYDTSRIPDANAIADLALKNFIEMRDRVADQDFLRQKKLAGLMHERFGDEFLPVYSQVSFSRIPYAEALAAGEAQEEVLSVLAKAAGSESSGGRHTDQQLKEAVSQYKKIVVMGA